ncbi:MAG: GntR family transcriptional regulator [Spirochaetales bacterium]
MDGAGFKSYKNPSLIERIKMDLHKRIVDGKFQPGEKLPSEPELADLLGISRNSLREAIGLLVNEGYLFRQKGVGTFITHSDPIIKGGIERLKGVAEFIKEKGYLPGSILVRFDSIDCDLPTAESLMLEIGEKVIVLETIKTASGKPVASCMDIIPGKYFKGPVDTNSIKESIFEYLQKNQGINICFAECTIIPALSDTILAAKLKVEVGSPILLLEQIHYDDKNRKIFCSKSYFPADKFTFKLIRKR